MKIKWLGHACFKISDDQQSIVIDPFKDGSVPGFNNIKEEANEVYCSHQHGDHAGIECIKTTHDCTFKVEVIDTYHDDKQGSLRGTNKIHIFTIGEYRIAHFGDLGCELTASEIEQLKGLDLALIPIGGFYTINAKQAYSVVQNIEPKVVIPMHYRSENFGYDVLGDVQEFTQLFDEVYYLQNNEYEYPNKNNAKVVVMKY